MVGSNLYRKLEIIRNIPGCVRVNKVRWNEVTFIGETEARQRLATLDQLATQGDVMGLCLHVFNEAESIRRVTGDHVNA